MMLCVLVNVSELLGLSGRAAQEMPSDTVILRIVDTAILRTCKAIYQEANTIVQKVVYDFVLASGPKMIFGLSAYGIRPFNVIAIAILATTDVLNDPNSAKYLENSRGTASSYRNHVVNHLNSAFRSIPPNNAIEDPVLVTFIQQAARYLHHRRTQDSTSLIHLVFVVNDRSSMCLLTNREYLAITNRRCWYIDNRVKISCCGLVEWDDLRAKRPAVYLPDIYTGPRNAAYNISEPPDAETWINEWLE